MFIYAQIYMISRSVTLYVATGKYQNAIMFID